MAIEAQSTPAPNGDAGGGRKFGAFAGVFTPSILTILGVIMYLRFGWVVGHAGLVGALLIVALSHVISLATGLSVSSIATNRTVGVGGAYYMISRSLGAPVGASVGIPLFVSQVLSVTFYVVGFTESLRYLFPNLDPVLTGAGTIALLTIISLKSTALALKAQFIVMAAIVLSIISFFMGSGEAPPQEVTLFAEEGSESFAAVFAVFFPAVTGIMAGVSMSGDLKDPREALPRGTLMAILAGFVVYSAFPIWLAMNYSLAELRDNLAVVWDLAAFPSLIYAGVFGATISSALGSILAAPRTLQALALDGLAPRIFAKGYGPDNEPRGGLLLTAGISLACLFLGGLDAIASVLTMFFLVTYGVTNLACGLERWASSPSFRPTFRVPAPVSLAGGLACFYVMSVIDLPAMLAATLICGTIYLIVQRRALGTTYGDARHGIWSALVRTSLHQLRRSHFHPMNWRPNVIVFGGALQRRPHLLELGSALVQDRGIVTYFRLLPGEVKALARERLAVQAETEARLVERYPNVFCRVEIARDIHRGAVTVAQSYGIGTFEANAVVLGWSTRNKRPDSYLQMVRDLAELGRSVLMVRWDAERRFGERERIDLWWGGMRGNGPMMMVLAFLLQSSEEFRDARVRILTVVDEEGEVESTRRGLARLCDGARLEATPRAIVRSGRSISEIMAEESAATDLAVIGFDFGPEDEPASAFFARYDRLMESLPTTLLVHGGHTFDGAPVLFDDAHHIDEEQSAAGEASVTAEHDRPK
jgi:amino acid transporter